MHRTGYKRGLNFLPLFCFVKPFKAFDSILYKGILKNCCPQNGWAF